jgi:hypothetical protein
MIDSTSPLRQAPDSASLRPGWGARLARHPNWLALGFYILLTVVLTFPLAFQLDSHIRGGSPLSDSYSNLWYMWWYGRALEQGLDPSRTSILYALLPSAQVLISSVINGLLMWPIVKLFGPLVAYNLGMLISFPLAGFFTYKLADEVLEGRSRWAAFAAGCFFTFSTYHFYRLEGHLGLVTVQWLPFYLWRLLCLQRRPSWRTGLLAGLGLALAGLSDLYYLGYFVLPVTTLWLIWFGITERRSFWRWANLRYYGLALLVGFAALLPFYSFFLNLDPDIKQSVSDRASDVRDFSADLMAFLLPNSQNPFFGSLTTPVYNSFKTAFPIEQAIFPGYVLLVLGLVAPFIKTIRNRWTFFLVGLATVGFILALGPRLHIAGQEIGPSLPYYYIYGKLPLLGNYRVPSRLSLLVLLGLAVLSAYTLTWLFERMKDEGGRMKKDSTRLSSLISASSTSSSLRKEKNGRISFGISFILHPSSFILILLLLSLAGSLTFSWPMATDAVTIPQVYHQIAAEPGDFLVLELPLDPRGQPLYYQTYHQKRLVGGQASRISNRMTLSWDQATYLGMFNPAESSAVINNGQALKAPGGPDIFPLDLTFPQMLQENKIGYIILRTNRMAFAWMEDFLVQQLGPPTSQEMVQGERLLAWRTLPLGDTTPPPVAAGNYRIRLGDGWNAGIGKSEDGQLLRLVEQDGKLLVTPGTPGPATLNLQINPYIRPQTIEVRLNGATVSRIEGEEPWKRLAATIPLNLKAGQNVIELHSVEGCLHPIDYIPNSPDLRCISFAVQNVRLTAS